MPGSTPARRGLEAAATVLPGAVLLAGCVWLAWAALRWLIGFEEQAAGLWYTLYLDFGRATLYGLAALALLALLHLSLHGRDDIRPRDPGDVLRWWSPVERALHWLFVLSFAVLLVTGCYLYAVGGGLPTALTRGVRSWHFGEAFMGLGSLLFLRWYRDAIPRRYDLRWLAAGGDYLRRRQGGAPLPAGRFNAGQKLWFWLQMLAAVSMAVSGYQLQYRFSRFDEGYLTVLAIHLLSAALFLCVLGVHFYLAVLGVRGALNGMVRGRVGRSRAERLHPLADVFTGSERPITAGKPSDGHA